MSHEFDYMSASEMRLRVARKDISPVDLTRRALVRANEVQLHLVGANECASGQVNWRDILARYTQAHL